MAEVPQFLIEGLIEMVKRHKVDEINRANKAHLDIRTNLGRGTHTPFVRSHLKTRAQDAQDRYQAAVDSLVDFEAEVHEYNQRIKESNNHGS